MTEPPDAEPQATFVKEHPTGHETRDVNVRAILLFGLFMIIAAVVIHVAIWGLLVFFARQPVTAGEPDFVIVETPQAPPEPRLQAAPEADAAEMRAAEEEFLNSYGWVDEEAGIARIPIEEAMALLEERGLPVRPDLPDVGEEPLIEEEGMQWP